ncbi:MAG TPA: YegS/Rv2252/BmrU family lipid kinase [Hanamia sp.]|jgi:diacylglycerol kinase (ATP)|nr:YegS/Rv2252/BmrU family lipid kinase [Hanamia sp.]
MSRKILFFINPISGAKSKINLEEKIIRKCEEKNISFEILFTSKDGDYDFLHDKIKNESITDIAICGGDGSIAPIVSSILNLPVNIGIIPLGSGNGLARTAGIPKTIDGAIDVIIQGNGTYTDVFVINNKLSTHVCGLGFDATVAHEFSKQKKRGLNSYTRVALKNFFAAKTFSFTIEAEKSELEIDAFLICIANSNQFGNNFKIAPQASICDGLLDIVVLKKTTKPQMVISFIKQLISGKIKSFSERNFHKKNILYFQTKKLKIKNPQLAPLHIDGDPAQSFKEFTIEILPAAYKLIHP